MRVTLQDIATKAGVTKTAVSLALRDQPGISAATRDRIRAIARELGYAADPILQRLAAYRHAAATTRFQSVIAWLNHWDESGQLRSYREFEQYWRGARLAARRLGYRLEEYYWAPGVSAREAGDQLVARGALGLLIPPHKPGVDWSGFDWGRFALLRFGLSARTVDSHLVTADHQRAMVMAVQKIHRHGYARLGFVYDAAHDDSMGGNFYGGFLWAHRLLELEQPIPPLDFNPGGSAAAGVRALKAWIKRHRPDAILTAVPQIPDVLRGLGHDIPRDIAVAGTSLHDIPVPAGIDQASHAIGQIAAEMLIKQISLNERGEPADPCRILVESRWQDGDSLPVRC